jgi:SAM-dependent methyltransferase
VAEQAVPGPTVTGPAGHPERVRGTLRRHGGFLAREVRPGRPAGRAAVTAQRRRRRPRGGPGGGFSTSVAVPGNSPGTLAASGFRVTGCDIAPQMLRRAAAADPDARVGWLRLAPRWGTLPFGSASVDAVVAASVLEYVPDPCAVLRECARVLRSGGVLLCPSPIQPTRCAGWNGWWAGPPGCRPPAPGLALRPG